MFDLKNFYLKKIAYAGAYAGLFVDLSFNIAFDISAKKFHSHNFAQNTIFFVFWTFWIERNSRNVSAFIFLS